MKSFQIAIDTPAVKGQNSLRENRFCGFFLFFFLAKRVKYSVLGGDFTFLFCRIKDLAKGSTPLIK